MAQDTGYNNEELMRILSTLASVSNTPQPDQSHQQPGLPYQPHPFPAPGSNAHAAHAQPYDPTQAHISHTPPPVVQDPRLANRQAQPQHRDPPKPQQLEPAKEPSYVPVQDVSTITEWKFGLRALNTNAAQNPEFGASISKLIKDQDRNTKDWAQGRTRILAEQKMKRENEAASRASISLPGLLDNTPAVRTPALEAQELTTYDAKVYRATLRLTTAQSQTLSDLGVPFFNVRPDLIVLEAGSSVADDGHAKIGKGHLLELQRKVLNHLMELYGD
ncbi:hypothetical protein P154DRAFT_183940 [Amniculicola lignicola CBS 123094]|uniref:Uncharacterized protein n=1 Tax=Amniculicola lignicola CBS 123094 TaxID=1392246 RepID=A0A6A5WZ79_9PLEO|nr:hypothetical protein P154DRAFT_183940 [Amniculicola lignicola CBS 123094]